MKQKRWINLAAILCLVVVVAVMPLFGLGAHFPVVGIRLFIFIIIAVTWLLKLETGLGDTAHAAFVGIGAYTSALLVMHTGLSSWLGVLLAGLVTFVFATFIGYLSMRITGACFFVITLCFAQIILLAEASIAPGFLGGQQGLFGVPRVSPLVIPGLMKIQFTTMTSLYYLTFVLMLLVVLIMYQIRRSRYGRTFRALQQSDFLAGSLGVNVFRFRMYAYLIGSVLAGIAGAFYAHIYYVVSPGDFSLHNMLLPVLAFVVVGGSGSLAGPIVGAIVLTLVAELSVGLAQLQVVVYSVTLLAALLLFRGGIISLPQVIAKGWAKIRRLRNGKEHVPTSKASTEVDSIS